MSNPTENTETAPTKGGLHRLPKPNAKKIVTYSLAAVGAVALVKAAAARVHRGEDGEVIVETD